jgi:hypothetical protein
MPKILKANPAPKAPKAAPVKTPAKGKAPASTPAAPLDRAPGVIARLMHHLQNGGGTTQELFEKLQADFPERGKGMLTTVKIQVKRLHASGKLAIKSETVDGRGVVYRAAR